MYVIRGNPEDMCSGRLFRILAQSGHLFPPDSAASGLPIGVAALAQQNDLVPAFVINEMPVGFIAIWSVARLLTG
jgi:hypothetical protein